MGANGHLLGVGPMKLKLSSAGSVLCAWNEAEESLLSYSSPRSYNKHHQQFTHAESCNCSNDHSSHPPIPYAEKPTSPCNPFLITDTSALQHTGATATHAEANILINFKGYMDDSLTPTASPPPSAVQGHQPTTAGIHDKYDLGRQKFTILFRWVIKTDITSQLGCTPQPNPLCRRYVSSHACLDLLLSVMT